MSLFEVVSAVVFQRGSVSHLNGVCCELGFEVGDLKILNAVTVLAGIVT